MKVLRVVATMVLIGLGIQTVDQVASGQGAKPGPKGCDAAFTISAKTIAAVPNSHCNGSLYALSAWESQQPFSATNHGWLVERNYGPIYWIFLPQCYWQVDFRQFSAPSRVSGGVIHAAVGGPTDPAGCKW